MKRTPLKRVPLKRKPRKLGRFRKPLRQTSKKTARRKRSTTPFRIAFLKSLAGCEYCGRQTPANELAPHEIAGGPDRPKALDKAFAMLGLCQLNCHDIVQQESKARQLARLYLSRPQDLDVVAFNRLRGKADGAITLEEVLAEAELIQECAP